MSDDSNDRTLSSSHDVSLGDVDSVVTSTLSSIIVIKATRYGLMMALTTSPSSQSLEYAKITL